MQVTVTGRFPIVRDGVHPLRAAVEAWRERGEATPDAAAGDAALRDAQAIAQRDLLEAQHAAGVDVPGDGYVPIYDEWFALAAVVEGVQVENAIRYLDTNTYYHRWRITAPPVRRGPSPAVAACRLAAAATDRPLKPCLFGPCTVWEYALKEDDGATDTAFDALVDVWAAEIADLVAAGATYVQLDESVLLRPKHRAGWPRLERALRRLSRAVPPAQIVVHFACGVAGDALPRLLDLPVAGIGLDLTDAYGPPNLAALRGWHGDKLFQAGIANAREIRVESSAELRGALEAVTAHVPAGRCWSAPSTALLYLPRHAAFEKLAALASAAHAFAPN
jgi:5-methyltetrahydropteroyltriglutamate--homocysteine methyltransferase